jgi:hypothetical protein
MDKVDDFSPGFGQEVLTYFSPSSTFTTKTVETVKYVGGGGGCSCPSKEQLCGITTEEKAVLPTEEITVSDSENSSDDPLSDEVYNNSLKSSEEIL